MNTMCGFIGLPTASAYIDVPSEDRRVLTVAAQAMAGVELGAVDRDSRGAQVRLVPRERMGIYVRAAQSFKLTRPQNSKIECGHTRERTPPW